MKKVLLTGVAFAALTATAFAQNNQAFYYQSGNYSQASAEQTGQNNTATFSSNGDGSAATANKALISQNNAGFTFSLNNNGSVYQQGHGHELRLTQIGKNEAYFSQYQANAFANATQNGLNNYISSTQKSADGTAVQATIEQAGIHNVVFISGQTDVVNGLGFTTASIKQKGNENYANLNQTGDANTASIEQNNSNWNTAYVKQNGAANKAVVEQAGFGGVVTTFNYVNLDQNGNGNTAYARQNGYANTIRLYESGNNNVANLNQTGSFLTVRGYYGNTAEQYGNNNSLTTNQTGTFQTVYSSQYGTGNSAYAQQATN